MAVAYITYMNPKTKQLNFVKDQLLTHGEVSRNTALRNNITRLATYIVLLKRNGWKFKTEKRAGDYVYSLDK